MSFLDISKFDNQKVGTGGGSVDSVTAADATITVSGTATDPQLKVTASTFDPLGAAATAQSNAESYASTAATNAQSNAEGYTNTQLASYTPTQENVNSVATSGATQTIPAPATDTINRIVLSANCTLTFPTAAAGKSFTLQVVQPGASGPFSVTWPGANLVWVAGTAPTQATVASKRDLYSFLCIDGSNWEGIQVSPSGGY